MRFREHRDGLEDSMKRLVEFQDSRELITHCKNVYDNIASMCGQTAIEIPFDPKNLKVELYSEGRPDHRIGWEKTYLVTMDNAIYSFSGNKPQIGTIVLGMADSPLSD